VQVPDDVTAPLAWLVRGVGGAIQARFKLLGGLLYSFSNIMQHLLRFEEFRA